VLRCFKAFLGGQQRRLAPEGDIDSKICSGESADHRGTSDVNKDKICSGESADHRGTSDVNKEAAI
jgi:hypothetical protein